MSVPAAIRSVGDAALLVEFGDVADEEAHGRVMALDAALADAPLPGVTETVPALTSLLVVYDPLTTGPAALRGPLATLAERPAGAPLEGVEHRVPVCYGGTHGPDLAEAAVRTGLSASALVARHGATVYRVRMYGFAPGYAYLGGGPAELDLPRKAAVVRDRPVGSVMIAGRQCIVTSLPMPTGWWVIGRTPLRVLRPDDAAPFLFAPGDRVRFEAVGAAVFADPAGSADAAGTP